MSTPKKSSSRPKSRPKSAEDGGKGIWSSMLDSVSTGKRLAEKHLLILGGTAESQKGFLDALSEGSSQRRLPQDRTQKKPPPVANRFALGYTYQDVLDADQDDILARLSLHLLSDPHPSFSPLLSPLFNPKTVPDFLAVILLDWSSPWDWLGQVLNWIRILSTVLNSADNATKEAMDENMANWRNRRKGITTETAGSASTETDGAVPLGPGEWDEALGIPLCVVCLNAEKIEILEREHGWKDEEFDLVQQYLRTVLLKHGASLIYTASAAPNSLQTLIRSSLDIHSLLQRNPLKSNVVDRDKVLIPPHWDSWGKIRVMQEGFDVEGVSNAWSVDIQTPASPNGAQDDDAHKDGEEVAEALPDMASKESGVVARYKDAISDPSTFKAEDSANGTKTPNGIEVECQDLQSFLAVQARNLDSMRQEDEQAQKALDAKKSTGTSTPTRSGEATRVSDHIGPVQLNMGGIQVDAEDMLRSLRNREGGASPDGEKSPVSSPDGTFQHDKLNAFFTQLASRGLNSATNSPK